jgi:hypothetical protein
MQHGAPASVVRSCSAICSIVVARLLIPLLPVRLCEQPPMLGWMTMPRAPADVLRMLEECARASTPSGPMPLSEEYFQAVRRWEALPENAEHSEKGWVLRADRSWRRVIASSRLIG